MSLSAEITLNGKKYRTDLHNGIDLSIPMEAGPGHVAAWYVDPIRIEPVRNGDWIGEVRQGGSVNFRNIYFNPHGHGTHTESLGHISPEIHSVNKHFSEFFCFAQLISVNPAVRDGDRIIGVDQLKALLNPGTEALILRTLPNSREKLNKNWSDQNAPYLEKGCGVLLREAGIRHLLLDLPSVDREQDAGVLQVHHEFWHYPENPRLNATISEILFIPDSAPDGNYLLNLQVAPFENDASPSRPLIFPLEAL